MHTITNAKRIWKFWLKNEQTKKDTISLDENKSKRSTGGAGKSGSESDTQTKFPMPFFLHVRMVVLPSRVERELVLIFLLVVILARIVIFLTIHITESIALNIFSLFEKEVYRKIALIHRRFVDFNRDAKCAFENSNDKRAEYIYNEYYDGILETIKKMHQMNTNGSRFLFDIDGTQESDADIYFGTDAKNCEGSTICGLLGLNPNALWDDTGLIKLLKDRGYKTCPNEPGDDESIKTRRGHHSKKLWRL